MSLCDVDFFFNEYVNWMRRYIEREIEWVAEGRDAGNLLCALGFVTYTEAVGRVRRSNFDPQFRPGDTEANFNETFDRLGDGEYGERRANEWRARFPKTSVYELVRCGLVDGYLPKIDAKIHMGPKQRRGLELEGGRISVRCLRPNSCWTGLPRTWSWTSSTNMVSRFLCTTPIQWRSTRKSVQDFLLLQT